MGPGGLRTMQHKAAFGGPSWCEDGNPRRWALPRVLPASPAKRPRHQLKNNALCTRTLLRWAVPSCRSKYRENAQQPTQTTMRRMAKQTRQDHKQQWPLAKVAKRTTGPLDTAKQLLGNDRCELHGRLDNLGNDCEQTANMMFTTNPRRPTIHTIMLKFLILTPTQTVS